MAHKFIPYSFQSIDKNDIRAVVEVLKADWVTQGPKIREFEEALAKYVGTKYAVAFSSGTAALHGACAAAGIDRGDEVIVPTLSFVATANCVLYCGAKPILVDVYDDTLTINVEDAEKKITKKTRAIIGVDFAGHPADWDKLNDLARRYKLILIADSAHALGSKFKDKNIGSIADLTTFSFHAVKTIMTGEGGAVTTNNKKFYEELVSFRHHGITKNENLSKKYGGWYYEIKKLGYNYRMTDIQAALGLSQLKKIDKFIKKRKEIWQRYNQAFGKIKGLVLPSEQDGTFCAWHLYTLRADEKVLGKSRQEIYDKLRKVGIGVQVHYIPIHMHSLYRDRLGYRKGDFPVAERIYEQEISLPLFPALTDMEQDTVITILSRIIDR